MMPRLCLLLVFGLLSMPAVAGELSRDTMQQTTLQQLLETVYQLKEEQFAIDQHRVEQFQVARDEQQALLEAAQQRLRELGGVVMGRGHVR